MITSIEKTQLLNNRQQFFDSERFQIDPCQVKPVTYNFYEIAEILINNMEEESISAQIKMALDQWGTGLLSLNSKIIFKISGDGKGKISLSFADAKDTIGDSLVKSMFPSIEVQGRADSIPVFQHTAALSGIPFTDDEDDQSWLTLFLRANDKKQFTICVVAQPIKDYFLLKSLEDEYAIWSSKKTLTTSNSISTNRQEQQGESAGGNKGIPFIGFNDSENRSSTTGETKESNSSREESSFLVQQYCELLESHMERMHLASSIGLWQTMIYVSSDDSLVLKGVQVALNSAALKEKNLLEFHLYEHKELAKYMASASFLGDVLEERFLTGKYHPLSSILHSKELAKLFYLPSEQYDGFSIKEVNDFDVTLAFNESPSTESWEMGTIFKRNKLTTKTAGLPYAALRQHCLVAGITGSGKTNTIISLLQNSSVPYLIIEPSKQEYRHLVSLVDNLHVYTPGNERISPIRLNPFYFPDGVSVMSHIDSLKAVFMSAFSMYASMPNILEQCLYSVYQKAGWDLNTSTNIYASTSKTIEHYPTIQHLYDEIDEYLNNSGYAEEQKSNIRAALLTRLKSLMTGSKGKLLNTKETFDFRILLEQPTVIELEEIADEDDKALIMGLFFIRLSEELKITTNRAIDVDLRHFTIIEEAHRLFKNHQENNNPEVANTKGKAVEFFCNLLSEIRSLGEGMVIVDQVPTKLAPDALKNTDTKIIHRLVSQDDAEYVAQSLVIQKDSEIRFLSQLKRGEVLFYTSGMYGPAHILIHSAKNKMNYVEEELLQQLAEQYNPFLKNKPLFHPIAEHIMEQDEKTKKQILLLYKKFYYNAIYGDTSLLNEVMSQLSRRILRVVSKFGYDIPEKQQIVFIAALLLKQQMFT